MEGVVGLDARADGQGQEGREEEHDDDEEEEQDKNEDDQCISTSPFFAAKF